MQMYRVCRSAPSGNALVMNAPAWPHSVWLPWLDFLIKLPDKDTQQHMHDSFLFWKPLSRTGSRRLHRIVYSCRKVMAPIWLFLIAPIRCLSSFMNRYYITWARPRGDLLQFLFIFTFFYKAHLLINDCEKGIKGTVGAFVFRDGNASSAWRDSIKTLHR